MGPGIKVHVAEALVLALKGLLATNSAEAEAPGVGGRSTNWQVELAPERTRARQVPVRSKTQPPLGTVTVLLAMSLRKVLQVVAQLDCTRMPESGKFAGCASVLTLLLVRVASMPPVPLRLTTSMPRPLRVSRIAVLSTRYCFVPLSLPMMRMPLPIIDPEPIEPAVPITLFW